MVQKLLHRMQEENGDLMENQDRLLRDFCKQCGNEEHHPGFYILTSIGYCKLEKYVKRVYRLETGCPPEERRKLMENLGKDLFEGIVDPHIDFIPEEVI